MPNDWNSNELYQDKFLYFIVCPKKEMKRGTQTIFPKNGPSQCNISGWVRACVFNIFTSKWKCKIVKKKPNNTFTSSSMMHNTLVHRALYRDKWSDENMV